MTSFIFVMFMLQISILWSVFLPYLKSLTKDVQRLADQTTYLKESLNLLLKSRHIE